LDPKEVVAFDPFLHCSHHSHTHHRHSNHLHHNERSLGTEVVVRQLLIELTIDFSSFAVHPSLIGPLSSFAQVV
jgi:hypothetical protein